MKRDNPYWKILKSTDEKVSVIHSLRQIAEIECDNTITSIFLFFIDKEFTLMSGAVYTRVEVHKMDSEMSRLVEQPWLQLMCCAVCLPHGCNFRWKRESPSGSKYWLVCRRWTLEIKFNKSLSFVDYQTSKLQCNY